ncbi:lipopolysaccharide assembly LapA domain-containing protein [Neptuniibacter sp.]|uniref:LapA family protein n=1 Tax=Neptuniibacter sp. TaxID=1962643 RepID=UPI0026153D19|nr:LapA family protein [Neptuniibacter sp.]MCP4594955.1 LapA family protein [Neptuniibacter sp.]
MRFVKTLIVGLLCLAVMMVGIMFTIHNTDKVTIDLVFVQLPEASLSLWLIATFVLGGFLGVLLSTLTILMLRTRLGSARRKINTTQKEIDQLRVSTLKDAV